MAGFTLPDLPYDYAALEPHVDEQTMRIHHDKHHATYVTNLNAALEKHPEFQAGDDVNGLIRRLDEVPEDIRTVVRNNGGGHANHTLFWEIMGPNGGGEPTGALSEAINAAFGDLATFKTRFADAAKGRFGSGWAWLVVGKGGRAGSHQHAEPGLAAHGRHPAAAGAGRVGARLLPQVPEPAPGLHRGVVERGELGGGRAAVRERARVGFPVEVRAPRSAAMPAGAFRLGPLRSPANSGPSPARGR